MPSEFLDKTSETIKGFPTRTNDYLKEVWIELQRVSWPSGKEVYGTTVVVLLCVFFFGAYLWLCDNAIDLMLRKLFRYFSA